MYKDAIAQVSLKDKVSEIRSKESYTVFSDLPETYTDAVLSVEDHRFYGHIGIDPSLRNGGYGKRVLEMIKKQLKGPIVLEVEEPNDEMSTRRIHFYKRLEFTLHKKPYIQPPYRKGDSGLPMLLMTYGDIDMESDFEKVKKTLYKEVYGQEI
jgi:ribosomal protein S18 acetylase RimI-like enzyme